MYNQIICVRIIDLVNTDIPLTYKIENIFDQHMFNKNVKQ